MKRKSISKSRRFEIFKRDGFACQYCGQKPPSVVLQIDHVVAVASGGDNDPDNLVTACESCNLGKSDRPLKVRLPGRQESLDRQKEMEDQAREYNEFLMESRRQQDEAIDAISDHWYGHIYDEPAYTFGPGRCTSIRQFLKHLVIAEVLEAVEIAHSRRPVTDHADDGPTFRYFCGVCWTKIRRNQEGGPQE